MSDTDPTPEEIEATNSPAAKRIAELERDLAIVTADRNGVMEINKRHRKRIAELESHLNTIGNAAGFPEVVDKAQLTDTIIKRMVRMGALVAVLREDEARIDWLGKEHADLHCNMEGRWTVWAYGGQKDGFTSARDAIDAMRKANP